MKKFPFFFGSGKQKKKTDTTDLDSFRNKLEENNNSEIIDNMEVISGGVLEGRSPDSIDLSPNHTHRNLNNEFDMLP